MLVAQLLTGDIGLDLKSARPAVQPILGFSNKDRVGTIQPYDDALAVTLRIEGYDVKRVMVDQGSAVEIMYPDLYKGLNLKLDDLTPYYSPLVSFEGRIVTPKGQIRLPVQTGSEVVEVDFIVVDAYSPYTAIVARLWLHMLGAVFSTLHQKVKYPSEGRLKSRVLPVENLDEGVRCEDLVKVLIGDSPERYFQVGSQMPQPEKEELIDFLKRNINVFSWSAYEAPRVDPEFICHHLRVNPLIVPKKQPPRRPSKEHVDAVKEEVTKLKQAGAIKKVFYPDWLANTVVVKKKSGKWRVCVDFTNLNKVKALRSI
ncbi:uncharacterized protein LOC136069372 [Quercus suber]|uniref:uncharacterized protein LOC136069372 n=1 Tax=Quercus suber TaxID=58331 RepID=UPI0032E0302D